ncbi:MAG TPA: hypothetical protein VEV37_08980 [Bryobacteraceae bacterium]|nr:hypothetical protein [Bryobacteraceae bacterium]
MSYKFLMSALAVPAAAIALLAVPAAAQTAKSKSSAVPRIDGHPDLSGIWTNATVTPMERPAQFAGKPTLTDAEAEVFENALTQDLKDEDGKSDGPLIRAAGSSGTGGYNALFIDRGSQMDRIDGVKRSSLIVDPPDGKIPPVTDAAKARRAKEMRNFFNYDDVKNRPLSERCIIGFGSTSGPPMMPVLYNNTYEFVQTKDNIMILVEMVHDIRVIRMNGTHPPSNVRTLLGDSIGHWDGDTLVVDTTNFRPDASFMGASENLHVIERFERNNSDTILYKVIIDDPSTFSKQWTMEFPFNATKGPVYEYACHEGNYAMTDIMGGAREMEKKQKK